MVKLAAFGLDRDLDWDCGGFGFDAPRRWDLVAVAQHRAFEKYVADFTEHNTVLIGDTTNDVHAGVGGGAKAVGAAPVFVGGLGSIADSTTLR